MSPQHLEMLDRTGDVMVVQSQRAVLAMHIPRGKQ